MHMAVSTPPRMPDRTEVPVQASGDREPVRLFGNQIRWAIRVVRAFVAERRAAHLQH